MFAIALDLLSERYTATQFNDRAEPEWPPHPARVFSAMTAAWADAEEPDSVEREALEWLESQPPPAITCSPAHRRAVVTHYVPVNDPTALTRDVSRNFGLMEQARKELGEAERDGDGRTVGRARAALARAEAKAIADGKRVGKPSEAESPTMSAAVLEVLPENRGKQGRTYPTVIPEEATVWFSWPDATASERHLRALDEVLARVGRIGHSSTLVSCCAETSAPPPAWVPGGGGDQQMRLRVPREGLVDRLVTAFESHQGSEPRLLPAAMISYRRPSAKHALPAPLLGGDWLILGIAGRTLPATRVLDIARAARGALLSYGAESAPILSGHQLSSAGLQQPTPPLEHAHLAVVPLPSVGHRYSDGSVAGIALVLPTECSDDERSLVEGAVQAWSAAGFELRLLGRSGSPVVRSLEDLGVDRADGSRPRWLDADMAARRRTSTRGYWCREARRWLTATPIALDRFPGKLRSTNQRARERAQAEAEESIARACSLAGLPGSPSVVIRLDAPLTGIPSAPSARQGTRLGRQYPGYVTGGGKPRVCVHAEIEFDQPVRGPVLIGAGRYFGYGLCLPCDEKVTAQ